MNGRNAALSVSGIAILLSLATAGAALARVGVTSTSSGDPIGKPVDRDQRVLRVGIDVFANERITTTANDRAQLVFVDGTALSVGPNSELTLDRYVYDPAKGTGTLAITAGKGILRLVGGAITKGTEATIRTPSGTIGIRGGITIVEIVDQNQTNAYFVFGRGMRGSSEGRSETATRPGSAITLRTGRPPSPPFLANQQALAGALGQLEAPRDRGTPGAPQAQGGATIERRMAQSQVTQHNSNNPHAGPGGAPNRPPHAGPPGHDAVARHHRQDATSEFKGTRLDLHGRVIRDTAYTDFNPATRGATRDARNNTAVKGAILTPAGNRLIVTTHGGDTMVLPYQLGGNYTVDNASTTFGRLSGSGLIGSGNIFLFDLLDSANRRVIVVGVQPGTVSDFKTTGFGAHTMLSLGSALPFMPKGSQGAFANVDTSSLFSAYSPVLNPVTASSQRSVFLQATLAINGTGATQTSFFGGVTGLYMKDQTKPDSVYASGGFSGTSRQQAGQVITGYAAAVGTIETPNGNAVGPDSGFMAFVPDSIQTDNVAGQAVTTRTVQAGIASPHDTLTPVDYYYVAGAAVTGAPANLGVNRTTRIMAGYGAALVENRSTGGVITDYQLLNMEPLSAVQTDASTNRVGMTISLLEPGTPANTLTLALGGATGSNAPDSAFVDDQRFAARESSLTGSTYTTGTGAGGVTTRLIAVTQQVVPNAQVDGVTPCVCEYLAWGYWSADIAYTSGPRNGQRDRVHIGTWVAGDLPTPAQLPTTGTAIYNGDARGNVVNGANRYVAAGTFQQNWNFATRTGAITINNFDGVNYAGTTAGSPTNVNFAGPITGTAGRNGNVSGSFFKSPSDPAAYQAGSFSIVGTGYQATGTFKGQR